MTLVVPLEGGYEAHLLLQGEYSDYLLPKGYEASVLLEGGKKL
jgi:hypothetical protein